MIVVSNNIRGHYPLERRRKYAIDVKKKKR